MTSRASSTTDKPAKKAAAKKKAAKNAAPAAVSTEVVVKQPQLRTRLHPGILASAMDLTDGDTRRIEVLSYTSVMVTM